MRYILITAIVLRIKKVLQYPINMEWKFQDALVNSRHRY